MKILTENYLKSLEKEILTENYSDLFDKVYSDFRKEQSEFKTEIIEIGKIYYRARVGNDTMEAAIDDLNIISKIPYFGNNMDKPPARFVQGGRFNRQGVSYLYLADNVETCISEIHLQVGDMLYSAAKDAKALAGLAQNKDTYSSAGNQSVQNAIKTISKYIYKFGKEVGIY